MMRQARRIFWITAAGAAALIFAGGAPARAADVPATSQNSPAAAQPSALPPVPESQGNRLSEQPMVVVKSLHFEGNNVFTSADLMKVAQPYLDKRPGHRLTSEDLEDIRTAITLNYINAGYINSGAVLPDQDVTDGVIRYRIIEGRLTKVNLTRGGAHAMAPTSQPAAAAAGMPGMNMPEMNPPAPAPTPGNEVNPGDASAYNGQPRQKERIPQPPATNEPAPGLHLLRDSYILDRVYLGAGPPLNIVQLKDRLELLRQDPNIEKLNAELKPGDDPGTSVLDLAVTERFPLHFGVQYTNNRSPSVGAYRVNLLASDTDLTGNGDDLSVRYGVLAGEADDMRFSGSDDFSIDYSLPLTPNDLTLLVDYTRSDDLVFEQPFAAVDITSIEDSLAATLRQPIYRSTTQELAAFATFSHRYNRTFLLGEPFSFSPGVENGKSVVDALRVGPEYTSRSEVDALSVRGTLSVGLGLPGATIHPNTSLPSSQFAAFLGQLQYVHRLPLGAPESPEADTQIVFRTAAQFSFEPLLPLEQFSIGGIDTVRGYRENQLVRDNGVVSSLELRVPVIQISGRDVLTLVPFTDVGYGWNKKNIPEAELLSTVGVGLVFTPTDNITARIYYGCPFKHFDQPQHDLQDVSVHFDVTVFAL